MGWNMRKKNNKTKGASELPLPTEFTPGQLIIAICIFLGAALVCFSLGVLVGKFEARRYQEAGARPPAATRSKPPELPAPKPNTPSTQKPARDSSGEGVQKSPRPVVIPTTKPRPPRPAPPSVHTKATETTPATDKNARRVTEHPAPTKPAPSVAPDAKPEPPAVRTPPKPTSPTPPAKPSSPEPSSPAKPSEPPAARKSADTEGPSAKAEPKPLPEAKPATASVETDLEKAQALEPLAEKPVQAKKPASPPEGTDTGEPRQPAYVIQVMSFSASNRKKAEAYAQELKAKQGLTPELVLSEDGQYVRVVVGNYPDQEAARAAWGELRKRPGFSECFVKRR